MNVRKGIIEMHEVLYFLTLCEEGTFTRAAKRCDVSQPSLTNAIKSLESKLGGKLFNRGKKPQFKTRLTELGELVKPHMRRISREAARACQVGQKYAVKKSAVNVVGNNSAEMPI